MRAIAQTSPAIWTDHDRLRRMVIPDRHRPGPAFGRLRQEQIPVWAIIGYVEAILDATGAGAVTEDVIARVSRDYDVQPDAVLASLLYYEENRSAIDVILEQNSATYP